VTAPAAPEVSLVVPSRGGAARLPLLMECLARQTHDSWEVVVVLDGDIDDSQPLVESWADRLPVRSIVFPENRGRPAALNAGLAAAHGSVLVRCDDDLTPGPDVVRDHALAHRTGHIGPYDESYRGDGYEDVDWGYRAHLAGLSIEVLPELETDHHVAATTTADRALRAYYSGSALRRFEAKHDLPASPRKALDPWNLAVRAASRVICGGHVTATESEVEAQAA
jgi:glycosyltransferase involved in cell wall biosynthesis